MKVLVALAIFVLVYFVFIKDDFPKYVEFQGLKYGPSKLQKSNDSLSKIVRYNSPSVENTDYLLILMPDKDTGGLEGWVKLFSASLIRQGYKFRRDGERKVGLRGNDIFYMLKNSDANLISSFVVEGDRNDPQTISAAGSLFIDLGYIIF